MKWGAYYRQSNKTVRYRIGSRRKASIGYFTPEQWQTLCAFFDGKCARCGKAERLSPDHIVPASRGGSTWILNLQPLCTSCNVRKSNIYTTDYRPEHVKEWARQEMEKMNENQTVYNYQDWRHEVFTEEGQVVFLKIRDNVQRLLKQSGAFKHTFAYIGITSDNYTMAACIDRLVELGEIVEVTRDVVWPDRVFIEAMREMEKMGIAVKAYWEKKKVSK